ncbi:spindle assembly checkpoint component isoform X2 [Tasmannia lanceolata]|uniref:spindle assembly checkpoint component isoform X2 n=1 Tax=Tasmannia lanceolata TaxID=3420 RepID=UPI004063E472
MAEGDNRKQLLTLIRDFATEKSQGERRVSDLKKRFAELRAELDAANADLENAKRSKEMIEQELRGSEVESDLNKASIQALEARTSLLQEEISKIGSDLRALKNEEGISRDEFVSYMFALNKKIRKFQEMTVGSFDKGQHIELPSYAEEKLQGKQGFFNIQDGLKDVEDKLVGINDQTHIKEQEYQEEQSIHKEILQELANSERRVFLMDAVTKETKELQDLARQTEESEKAYASYGEELQRRYACPSCQFDNMGDLGLL